MKVKLAVSKEKYDDIKQALVERGIEIDDDAELLLCENNRFADTLTVKDPSTNGRVLLSVDDVVSIESYGHTVEVYTQSDNADYVFEVLNQLLSGV